VPSLVSLCCRSIKYCSTFPSLKVIRPTASETVSLEKGNLLSELMEFVEFAELDVKVGGVG
jgi:predicted metal-binding transcription factor (methanogenesis marker protein 9)